VHGIHAYRYAEKNGKWLTMSEAAKLLGVTNHVIPRLTNAKRELKRKGLLERRRRNRADPVNSSQFTLRNRPLLQEWARHAGCGAANGWVLECTNWPSAACIAECLGGGTILQPEQIERLYLHRAPVTGLSLCTS
jgi:hypothetical protein